MPLVSVILPSYNAADTVKLSIESVISQSFDNWELIILDDCSSDSTAHVIEQFLVDPRIKLFSFNVNHGVAYARNYGLKNAKGQFICFLDSDDVWHSEKLTKQLRVAKGFGECAIIHSHYNLVNQTGRKIGIRKAPRAGDYNRLLFGNYIGMSTALVCKKHTEGLLFSDVGHEDYVFWLDMCRRFNLKTICLKECLVDYMVGNTSLSSNKIKAAKWTWLVYRKSQGLNLLTSVLYFSCYFFRSIFIRLVKF